MQRAKGQEGLVAFQIYSKGSPFHHLRDRLRPHLGHCPHWAPGIHPAGLSFCPTLKTGIALCSTSNPFPLRNVFLLVFPELQPPRVPQPPPGVCSVPRRESRPVSQLVTAHGVVACPVSLFSVLLLHFCQEEEETDSDLGSSLRCSEHLD